MLPIGSVLFSSRAPIGHIAITSTAMCTNQGFKSFIPEKNLDALYLYFCLKYHTPELQALGNGATFKEVSKRVVEEYKIPLPPLATQKHIARVLEQADQLCKQAQQMESELNQLAQSLFLEMFGDPVANQFNWNESTLGYSCRKITDGTHHSPPLISEGVPYITAKHLKEWGLDFFSDPTYVSQESHEQIYSRCAPEQGDVLYIKDGATTGIAALNEYSFPFSMLSSLALLKPDENFLLSTYLCHWLNSPKVKTVMLSNMAGAGITRLTLTKIKDAKILLPPIEKQKQFELRLREIHSFTINAREQIRKCNDLIGTLMQRAFNGELTAQERKAA